jgi:hypothetical protein
MNSFILNQRHPCQTINTTTPQRKFILLEVIPNDTTDTVQKNELQKILAGFYLEVEEVYNVNIDKIYSRSRPFELAQNFNQKCNSVIFNKTIPNELFEINGINVFYTMLNIHLRSRDESQFDLEFEVRYVY